MPLDLLPSGFQVDADVDFEKSDLQLETFFCLDIVSSMRKLLAKSQIDIGWTIDLCKIESACVFDWRMQSRNYIQCCCNICLPYSTSVLTAFRKQSESFLSVGMVVTQSSEGIEGLEVGHSYS